MLLLLRLLLLLLLLGWQRHFTRLLVLLLTYG
jgi:hypothetical protein